MSGTVVSADQRLDDLGHALHPLFEAAFGAVGWVEDVGEVLKSVGGGDEDRREGVASSCEERSPSFWARLIGRRMAPGQVVALYDGAALVGGGIAT